MKPHAMAGVVLLAVVVAWWSSYGQRLVIRDGDLTLVRWYWWGLRERVVGQVDGARGMWWIVRDGRAEPWTPPPDLSAK
jgi:hypothetical protein